MEKRYKIYSLETSSALYGVVNNAKYPEEPHPKVLCEVDLGYTKENNFSSDDSALGFINEYKEKLQGKTLVIIPTINVPYF